MSNNITHSRYFITRQLPDEDIEYRTDIDWSYTFDLAVLCSDLRQTENRMLQLENVYKDCILKIGKVHIIIDPEFPVNVGTV